MTAYSDQKVKVVDDLEEMGLTLTAIANRLDVQRQTIYNMIGARNARPEPVQQLRQYFIQHLDMSDGANGSNWTAVRRHPRRGPSCM